jgi:transcriptional regulator with XRE-family HTH domain
MILVEKCSRRFIMDLGKRLKAKRKEKNISAEYLAKELGISVSTVYRYEDSSILKIPVSTFEKMCDILGTTPAQMMGNVPEKTVDIKSGNDLPVNFDNPKDAMEFLLKLPTVADMIRQRWMTRQWWHLQMKFYSSYNL